MATQPHHFANTQTADGSQVEACFLELFSNITNDNIASAASIALTKLASDSFTTYTPTWTGSVSNPAIGNGTLVGRYQKVGRKIFFYIKMTAGTTTTFGSGYWIFTLPVTSASATMSNPRGFGVDSSDSNKQYPITIDMYSTTQLACKAGTTGGTYIFNTNVDSAVPFTWAQSDTLEISGCFESAA